MSFRDVYFLRGSFRREKVPFFPRDRPTCLLGMILRFSCKAVVISFSKSHIKLSSRSSQVKRTPQDYMNEFTKNLIRKLNPLVVVDVRITSAFLQA